MKQGSLPAILIGGLVPAALTFFLLFGGLRFSPLGCAIGAAVVYGVTAAAAYVQRWCAR